MKEGLGFQDKNKMTTKKCQCQKWIDSRDVDYCLPSTHSIQSKSASVAKAYFMTRFETISEDLREATADLSNPLQKEPVN